MAITGDFAIFGKLKAMIGRLEQVPKKMAAPLARKLDARFQKQFDTGTDAYGKPWAPLAVSTIRRKGGDARILIRTGMSRAVSYVASLGGGVRFTIGGALKWHMQPSRNRPARPVLPIHGLPATWRADAVEVGGEEFAKVIGGRA